MIIHHVIYLFSSVERVPFYHYKHQQPNVWFSFLVDRGSSNTKVFRSSSDRERERERKKEERLTGLRRLFVYLFLFLTVHHETIYLLNYGKKAGGNVVHWLSCCSQSQKLCSKYSYGSHLYMYMLFCYFFFLNQS